MGVIYWHSRQAFHLDKHKWAVSSRGCLHTLPKSLVGACQCSASSCSLVGEKKCALGQPLKKPREANFYILMLTDSLKLYERDFMASCRRSNTNVNGSDGHGEHPWSGSWKEHSQEETQECGRVDEGISSPSLSPLPPMTPKEQPP